MGKVILVMIGGGLGATLRYGVSMLSLRILGTVFPWGTLIVNLMGCFLIGSAYTLAEENIIMGPNERLFFITGFLGGLTTFSSFAWESSSPIRESEYWLVIGNIAANNVGGLMMVFTGIFVIKYLLHLDMI